MVGFPLALYKPAMAAIRSGLTARGMAPVANKVALGGTDLYDHALKGDDWKPMINHVIVCVERQQQEHMLSSGEKLPVIGIGHSLGV
jgi:hypothetical protein